MKSIKEILDLPLTPYKGSEKTRENIRKQILQRYGKKCAAAYDPLRNCKSFVGWLHAGYKVKKGEKPMQSISIIEKRDASGNVVQKFPRAVYLFYIIQVERINA